MKDTSSFHLDQAALLEEEFWDNTDILPFIEEGRDLLLTPGDLTVPNMEYYVHSDPIALSLQVAAQNRQHRENRFAYFSHSGLDLGHQTIAKQEFFHKDSLLTLIEVFNHRFQEERKEFDSTLHDDLRHYYLSSEYGKNHSVVEYRFSRWIEKLQRAKNVPKAPSIGRVYVWTQSKYSTAFRPLSLQSFPKWIRDGLASQYYFQVDMINAHPSILLDFCQLLTWLPAQINDHMLGNETTPQQQEALRALGKELKEDLFQNLKFYCRNRQVVVDRCKKYLGLDNRNLLLQKHGLSTELGVLDQEETDFSIYQEEIVKKFMTSLFYGGSIKKFCQREGLQALKTYDSIWTTTIESDKGSPQSLRTENIKDNENQILFTISMDKTTPQGSIPNNQATSYESFHKAHDKKRSLFSFKAFREDIKSITKTLFHHSRTGAIELALQILLQSNQDEERQEQRAFLKVLKEAVKGSSIIIEKIPLIQQAKTHTITNRIYSLSDLLAQNLSRDQHKPKPDSTKTTAQQKMQHHLWSNKYSVFMAYLLQEIERQIMGTLEKMMVRAGRRVDVYLHDGFLVRKNVWNCNDKCFNTIISEELLKSDQKLQIVLEGEFPNDLMGKFDKKIKEITGFYHLQFGAEVLKMVEFSKFITDNCKIKATEINEKKWPPKPKKSYSELLFHYEKYWGLAYFADRSRYLLGDCFYTKEALHDALPERYFQDDKNDKNDKKTQFTARYFLDEDRKIYSKFVLIEKITNSEHAAPSGTNIAKRTLDSKSKMENNRYAWPLLNYSTSDLCRKTLLSFADDELLDLILEKDKRSLILKPLYHVENFKCFNQEEEASHQLVALEKDKKKKKLAVSKLAVPFFNHFFILLKKNQQSFEYVIKFLAKIAHFPAERVDGCGLFLWSQLPGGNGKSTAGHMATDLYYPFGRESQSLDRVFARFSQVMEFSFLLHLEDNPLKLTEKHKDELKSRLTAKEFPVEFKNGPTIYSDNFCRLIVTCNDPPTFLTDQDRRWAVFECSQELANQQDYFLALRAYWDNLYVRQSVLRTLLSIDVFDFHCERDRPPIALKSFPQITNPLLKPPEKNTGLKLPPENITTDDVELDILQLFMIGISRGIKSLEESELKKHLKLFYVEEKEVYLNASQFRILFEYWWKNEEYWPQKKKTVSSHFPYNTPKQILTDLKKLDKTFESRKLTNRLNNGIYFYPIKYENWIRPLGIKPGNSSLFVEHLEYKIDILELKTKLEMDHNISLSQIASEQTTPSKSSKSKMSQLSEEKATSHKRDQIKQSNPGEIASFDNITDRSIHSDIESSEKRHSLSDFRSPPKEKKVKPSLTSSELNLININRTENITEIPQISLNNINSPSPSVNIARALAMGLFESTHNESTPNSENKANETAVESTQTAIPNLQKGLEESKESSKEIESEKAASSQEKPHFLG